MGGGDQARSVPMGVKQMSLLPRESARMENISTQSQFDPVDEKQQTDIFSFFLQSKLC